MNVVAVALVVKSTTRSDDAAARTARAFWSSVAAFHVHDFEQLAPGIHGCRHPGCQQTIRRIPG